MLSKIGFTLVLLMALLQGFYSIFAYLDPVAFSAVRGTVLESQGDLDWVKIYASRTLFVALIIMFLLYLRNFKVLLWATLFGTVMPITDGWLAYQAGASTDIVAKHVVTVVYLIATFMVLQMVVKRENA
ncbi:DUF4267 domain-containing protein [Hahella aquimaris]|uniref:DUF4267 domain-containing protein n=1 Tax=Hahella sp. HNIBRBA332 TaxID=3015983 RepID=UPI00273B3583|nr:DUF4267 domain-containing protein [Hahella sp. HNIBRBA332]WLQ13288.1 DUF4267 domain-containing protein [Hahella sp. HNIBRBA332]